MKFILSLSILAIFSLSAMAEQVAFQRFVVASGACESTNPAQKPEGYPTIVKIDTQTGDTWVLIRLHKFPYSYGWEIVSQRKPK